LLLRFKEKDDNTVITIEDTETPTIEKDVQVSKRMRLEEEELLVYGAKSTKTSVHLSSYIFEVCDSLINLSPIGWMSVGERARNEENLDEDDESDKRDVTKMELEVVASVGYGKNGAVCVLHNTLRPKILTSFELSGCLDMWTVIDDSQLRRENKHSFMILTQRKSTMILKTGDEITDIHHTGFACNTPTIFVGNLGSNRYIVQVTSESIRLIQGTRLVQNIPIDLGSPLTNVSIADPYICVRAANGQVVTLALRDSKGNMRLFMNRNRISGTATCISIYRDTSGMFTTSCDDYADLTKNAGGTRDFGGYMKAEPGKAVEDEEDLLYGETGSKFKMQSMVDMTLASNAERSDWWRRFLQPTKPSYWLFVTRDNGNLEIYSVPDLRLMYMVTEVGNGNKVLTDAMEFVPLSKDEEVGENSQKFDQSSDLLPREILMIGLGHNGSRPLLLIRMKNDLYIYRAFRYIQGNLKVRFRRMRHSIIYSSIDQQVKEEPENYNDDNEEFSINPSNTQKLRQFNNINGLSGVCVCGNRRSYFVYLTIKGELRTHLFNDDTIKCNSSSIRCFAEFNNVNCPNGFLYFNILDDNLKISAFPEQLSVDADCPMQKSILRSTPQHIIYHPDTKVYGVVLDNKDITNKYFRFNGEDKEQCEDNRGERFLYPQVDKFTFVLVSPSNWQIVPEIQKEMDDWEHVMALKMVMLAYEGAQSGLKGYICMGTNFNYSEDITSRGRILLFDLIEVVPEPDKPWTKYKLKQIYSKEQKGPVSAVACTNGLLVTSVGQKVYLWQLKDQELTGVAFIDTNIFIHQMTSIKSLILVADVYKSITVLRFQEQFKTLSIVSRDFNPLMVYQVEYMVDNSNLGFITTDAESNISLFMYQPESRESCGGQKLIRRADYHLGQKVNAMFRVACNLKQQYDKKIAAFDNKHMTFFATLDGGFGFILPLPEKNYRRLFMLQNVLLTHSAHLCGLNPKAFRTIKQWKKILANPARSILDGELIWQYMYLNQSEKLEIAKKIGTKVEEIYQDIYEIDTVSRVF
jgi:cleavage and polyadenylation specificity factor subunit 1